MGKGDLRTRRGKIWRGTTGVSRPRKKSKTPRPAAPSRKVKAFKDLTKAVAQPIVKKPVVEAVKPQVAEVAVLAIEKVQPVVENVVVETAPPITIEVEAPVHTETKAVKKEKAPVKKTSKPVVKKAAAAKKPTAKKASAKKKK